MNRDPLEIIERMFEALLKGEAMSINQLAKLSGLHNITIRRYIKLIELVQHGPELEIIKTKHSIILRARRHI